MMKLLKQLQALETELHHPGVRCSRERLEDLLHVDFHELGRSGIAYSRDTIITYLSKQESWPQVLSDAFALEPLAADVVLLTYRSAQVAADGELSRHTLRSSIWMLTLQKWQLRYHQGTPAASTW